MPKRKRASLAVDVADAAKRLARTSPTSEVAKAANTLISRGIRPKVRIGPDILPGAGVAGAVGSAAASAAAKFIRNRRQKDK